MKRYYCWRVGDSVEINDGEVCPECGFSDHVEIKNGICGHYVAMNSRQGKMCALPYGHNVHSEQHMSEDEIIVGIINK